MTHIQLPDTWSLDPAVAGLSDAAQAGFLRLLSWSAFQRTDGALPKGAAVAARVSRRALAELVAAGFLIATADGWQAAGPEQYLFTEDQRRKKAKAGNLGNAARWGHRIRVADGIAPAIADGIAGASQVLSHDDRQYPVPSTRSSEEEVPAVGGETDADAEWRRRFRLPPTPAQLEAMADAWCNRPTLTRDTIRDAPPKAKAAQVVGRVLGAYHAAVKEDVDRAEREAVAWEATKARERAEAAAFLSPSGPVS